MIIRRVDGPKHKSKVHRVRSISQIKWIIIHHGATLRKLKGTNYLAYLKNHVENNGWSIGGYTYGVEPNGEILQGYHITDQTNHVGNYNPSSLGIVLPGDFRYEDPTPEQWKSLYWLLNHLKKMFPHAEIKGHQEVPGYEWKPCPSLDMNQIRRHAEKYSEKEIVIQVPKKESVSVVVLKRGDRSPDVKTLQENLKDLGHDAVVADGIFGLQTENAVKSFQRAANLTIDGVAGPQTLAKLKSVLEATKKVSAPKKEVVTFTLGGRKYKIEEV